MKKFLFYFLIATFPLGVLTRFTPFPSINVYLEDLVVLLIVLFSGKEILRYLKKSRNSFLIIFYMFVLVGIVGVAGHVRGLFPITSSILYLSRISCYLLLLIPLMNMNKKTLWRMKLGMLISGFVFILLGYIQYLYYPALRNLYYLGWDDHLYRLFSTLLDPNFAGAFIVLIILLYSAFMFEKIPRLFRYSRKDILRLTLFICGYLFLFPALLLTYSRSSYIMAIFSFVLFLILIKQKKLLLILGALLVIGIFLLPKNLGGEGVKLLRTASILSRTIQYERSLKIIGNNPVIGVGFNSLRFVSGKYGFIPQKDLLTTHAGAGVPNSYLFVMATTGVVGLMLVAGFLLLTLKGIYRVLKEDAKDSLFAAAAFSSLVGVLVGSLFENVLFFSQIMLWMILLMGILFGAVKTKQGN